MRPRYVAALTLLAAVVFTAPALAQRQGGGGFFGGGFGRGGGASLNGLLRMEEVRKEVELLDDQWTQIQKIQEDARSAAQAGGGFDREAFQNLSQEEQAKKRAELTEQFQKVAKETDAKVKEVLLPHQTERLEQLAVQQQGVRALGNPEVAGKLKLSDEQNGKIKSIQDAAQEKMLAAFRDRQAQGENAPQFNIEEFRAEQQKVESEMLAVLTDEQKKEFEALKGKEFKFPERQGGGQGRRPGGAGQRPNTDNQ